MDQLILFILQMLVQLSLSLIAAIYGAFFILCLADGAIRFRWNEIYVPHFGIHVPHWKPLLWLLVFATNFWTMGELHFLK